SALVAWAWLIDLEQGDVITVALDGPSGPIAENTLDPLERDKATYSAYTGKRMAVAPGTYRMQIRVERDGTAVIDEARSLTVN
ncbi:MAG: M23 family peptidase, partial [Alphaproteobacteria bacterium]|nr:M23 family peptidase [Alphaproteobacteria bacterium]